MMFDGAGNQVDIHDVVADRDSFVARLVAMGGDPGQLIDVSKFSVWQPRPEVLGAFTLVRPKGEKGRSDLLICSDGLLLVPFEQSLAGLALGGATQANQRNRVLAAANEIEGLRAEANRWLPNESIATLKKSAYFNRIDITLVDGTKLRLVTNNHSIEIPVAVEDPLAALLGDRLK